MYNINIINRWITTKMTKDSSDGFYNTNICPRCGKESLTQTACCPTCGSVLKGPQKNCITCTYYKCPQGEGICDSCPHQVGDTCRCMLVIDEEICPFYERDDSSFFTLPED